MTRKSKRWKAFQPIKRLTIKTTFALCISKALILKKLAVGSLAFLAVGISKNVTIELTKNEIEKQI